MRVAGSYELAAPRQRVWDALQDPAVLARTLPGCESLEVTGPGSYAATLTAGVASVKGTYRGEVALSEQEAPASYRLAATGAGAPGTVQADAFVRLEEQGSGTIVTYEADAVIGGMIGGVGQRMLIGVAKKTAGEFFSAVERDLLGVPAMPAPVAGAPAEVPPDGTPPYREPAERWLGQSSAADATGGPTFGPTRTRELLAAGIAGAAIALVGVMVGRRLTAGGDT